MIHELVRRKKSQDQVHEVLKRQFTYFLAVNFCDFPCVILIFVFGHKNTQLKQGLITPDEMSEFLNSNFTKGAMAIYFLRGSVLPLIRLLDREF